MQNLNAKYLRNIFETEGFKQELEEISSYCANIKQEGPIMHLLAKHLWKKEFDIALEYPFEYNNGKKKEKGKTDLWVDGKRIEAKFFYESDLAKKGFEEPVDKMIEKIERNIFSTWNVPIPIVKDTLIRRPNIFILIIQSRNLLNLEADKLERICWRKPERMYNKNKGYEKEENFKKLESFLGNISSKRPFNKELIKISANSFFPSTYHIYICEFEK